VPQEVTSRVLLRVVQLRWSSGRCSRVLDRLTRCV
jgi:hypothetical protein